MYTVLFRHPDTHAHTHTQTTCFSGLPDVTEPSNHLQHHHQKFATAAVAAMATPHQLPATIAGEPLLHNYHHHHHTQQHHHLLQQQQHHHHHHPNIGSNHHPPYPGHNKQKAASCREAGGYIVDFMHSCNKAPPSPGRASPSSSSMRQLPDDISAKSDTDLSGDKKDFVRRQNSSSGGAGRRFRRRSGHHGGGGSGGDCMGLPCVSCSLCVAILAVLVLLGLAVALSVADVDVVAGWFGGGRGGPKSNELRMRVVRRVLLQTPLIGMCICVMGVIARVVCVVCVCLFGVTRRGQLLAKFTCPLPSPPLYPICRRSQRFAVEHSALCTQSTGEF